MQKEGEQEHRRGEPEPGGVLAVGLLGKKVPFLQRCYHCLPLWIAFFTTSYFYMNRMNIKETGVFCQKKRKIGKKPLRSRSSETDFELGHTEERDGITIFFYVVCCFTKQISSEVLQSVQQEG